MSPDRFPTYRRRDLFSHAEAPILAERLDVFSMNDPHDHEFMEIQFVLAGQGVHQSVLGDTRVRRGSAFVLRPGTWHNYGHGRAMEVFVCCFGIELLTRELAWVNEDPTLNFLFHRGPLTSPHRGIIELQLPDAALDRCTQHLEALRSLTFPREMPGTRADQIGLLLLVLGELARHGGAAGQSADQRPARTHPAVRQALRLLESDLVHAWSLADLAQRTHVTPSYLVRLFKADTGIAPMAYLARLRAERAATLLLRTNDPIADVAAAVGWADPNYFSRRFKAHFGLSASVYRSRFSPPPTSNPSG